MSQQFDSIKAQLDQLDQSADKLVALTGQLKSHYDGTADQLTISEADELVAQVGSIQTKVANAIAANTPT